MTKTLTYKNSYNLDELLTVPIYIQSKYGPKMFMAIFDTGAETSAVSNRVKELLDLQVSDSAAVRGIHGVQICSVVKANISFDCNAWLLKRKMVVCNSGHDYIDIMIGLDIIRAGEFNLKKVENKLELSFNLTLTEKE